MSTDDDSCHPALMMSNRLPAPSSKLLTVLGLSTAMPSWLEERRFRALGRTSGGDISLASAADLNGLGLQLTLTVPL